MSNVKSSIDTFLEEFEQLEEKSKVNKIVELIRNCELLFSQEFFTYLLTISEKEIFTLKIRRIALDQIIALYRKYENDKDVNIKDDIISLGIKIVNLKITNFEKNLHKDFKELRGKALKCLEVSGKGSNDAFTTLERLIPVEQDKGFLSGLFRTLNIIDPLKATPILFKYIIDDKYESVGYWIHYCLRENLQNVYDWSKINGYFTEDFLERIFNSDKEDVKYNISKTLEFAGVNPIHEKYFLERLYDNTESLRVRKRALKSLGQIGCEKTISRLVSIKDRRGIFQVEADKGLDLYADRLTTEKEKLVDVFVRLPGDFKGFIWKTITVISGVVTFILSIVGTALENPTPKQILNIGIVTAIFSVITLAMVIIFILIPSLSKYTKIHNAKKEIREKL